MCANWIEAAFVVHSRETGTIGMEWRDMSNPAARQLAAVTPDSLVGTYRRFGIVGPVYEIIEVLDEIDDGDVVMKIRVLESGEETEYHYSKILDDPKEA